MKAIIASLDVDGDGKIQWREFSALMADRWLGQEVRSRRRRGTCGSGCTPRALSALGAV